MDMSPGRRQAWRRFTAPAVLLLLHDESAHGYGLLARLPEVFPSATEVPDAGSVYRLLRVLEADGVLTSSWNAPGAGPGRRMYALTDVGRAQFEEWTVEVEREVASLGQLLAALRKAAAAPPPTDSSA